MSYGPEREQPTEQAGDGRSEALTFAFSDSDRDLHGVARLGLAEGRASGLAILFSGGAPRVVVADSVESATTSWDELDVAGLRSATTAPMSAWSLTFRGEIPLELRFEAVSPQMSLASEHGAVRIGGMQGYEHLCHVTGSAAGAAFSGLGQRSRSWGDPDWDRLELARTVTAWLDDGHAVNIVAVRAAGVEEHGGEQIAAHLFDADRHDSPVVEVFDPRLSTAYDEAGRQRRAGIELYVTEGDELALRAAGEAIAGTSLDLGRLRLQCAFFRWRMDGRSGIGRYDLLRRA